MQTWIERMKLLVKDEEGAAAVEYGVLVAGIIALCIALIFGIGQYVRDGFQSVDTAFSNSGPGTAGTTSYGQ